MSKLFKQNLKNVGNLFLLKSCKFCPKVFTHYKNIGPFLLGYFTLSHPEGFHLYFMHFNTASVPC